MQVQRSRVNDIELAYRIDGAAAGAPWLVFSHSLACDQSMWDAQLAAFGDFRLLRFDTRGHGASDAPAGEYTMELLADDVLALLDVLGIRRCHFVGLSMGGMIGQQLALRAPTRLLSLILADTSSRYPATARPMWVERIALVRSRGMDAVLPSTLDRWFTPRFREQHPEEVSRIAALVRSTPVAGYVGCAHAISHIDFTARLGTIDCPTLVMVGTDDQGTPVSMAEEIVQAIEGSHLEIIPDAAHLSNVEQPQRFNSLLRRFLDSCS
jgi:3-oxoadipate enol-lactonase